MVAGAVNLLPSNMPELKPNNRQYVLFDFGLCSNAKVNKKYTSSQISINCVEAKWNTLYTEQIDSAKKSAYISLKLKTFPAYTDTINKIKIPNTLNVFIGNLNSINIARSTSFEAGYTGIFIYSG